MSYEDCRCNDSKCQESKPHWECKNCGALNCKHARVSCLGCGEWRFKCEKPEAVFPVSFWTGTNALRESKKR